MAVKRHVPLRTCVSCGSKRPKKELTRIVISQSDGVKVDRTGKLSGRGVYLCGECSCPERVPDRSKLEYALRVKLSEADLSKIWSEVGPGGTVALGGGGN